MDRYLERVFAEASGQSATVAITLPAPARPVEQVAAVVRSDPEGFHGPGLRWGSPAPERDGRVWSFVGWGEAARIEASGEERFDAIQTHAETLFSRLVLEVHPDVEASPPPRLYGGIAFRPEVSRSDPWADFRDASFALPRILYGVAADRAFLRVTLRRGDAMDPGILTGFLRRIAKAGASKEPRPALSATLERTSLETWDAMIVDALARIRSRELEKVVPMALCRVIAEGALDPNTAIECLGELYPDCVRFAVQRGDSVFLGASPERLVDKRGLRVEVDALAGSAARRTNGEDPRAAALLLESDKDRREHRVVVNAIRSALESVAQSIQVPNVPVIRTLRNVHHLWTPVSAVLSRPMHVLELVRALHPTPAVCGTPREAAIRWIAEHEPAPRGWFAGAVGWFDALGDGAFSVAIRSGVLARRQAWLYAGAGIVEGSDARAEYAETRMKQAPMLAALGLTS